MNASSGARHALACALALAALVASTAGAQTTGLIPINDLGAGTYAGFQGGLYPGGVNAPPPAHLAAAQTWALGIVPRDVFGNASASGWIGMIAVGMSNTTHEFGAFERNGDADPTRNARVVLLDTGFGGQSATVLANPSAGYWTTMTNRLTAMGLTPAQVQVAWLKEAEANPPNNFPLHAQALRDTLKKIANNLHDKFANLKLCYVSSRIYGGYAAQGSLNPEPQAYESGFAVKWMIEDQIGGDPQLNYDPLAGDVRSPLLLWGPYLWADGTNPRSDGLTWLLSDLEADHTHPSPSGEQKVAGLLASFFASDVTAAPWWPAQTDARLQVVDAIHDAYVSAAAPSTNFGSDPLLFAQGGATPLSTYMRFDVHGVTAPILMAKLSLRVDQSGGGAVRRVDDTSWNEGTLTFSNAPAIGAGLVAIPPASRDGTIGANLTPTVLADADGQLSFALTTTSTGATDYHSKEDGQPPRLVLVLSNAVVAAGGVWPRAFGLSLAGPNPTARGARISLDLPSARAVDVAVFSIGGRRVRAVAGGEWPAGRHELEWDGLDSRGRAVGAGVYLIRAASAGSARTIKVVVAR